MTDRSARFQHWFQIITNVAILFGLGLVVYELNQSKQPPQPSSSSTI